MRYRFHELQWSEHELLQQLVSFYCEVWKEPPWFENFWTSDIVLKSIFQSFKNQNAVWRLALDDSGSVVGFTTGHEADRRYLIDFSRRDDFPEFLPEESYYYAAEIAVVQAERHRGLGAELMKLLVADAEQLGLRIVGRTKNELAEKVLAKNGFVKTMFTDGQDSERFYWLR